MSIEQERVRRIRLNDGVFRAANAQLEEHAGRFGANREALDPIYECGDGGCE